SGRQLVEGGGLPPRVRLEAVWKESDSALDPEPARLARGGRRQRRSVVAAAGGSRAPEATLQRLRIRIDQGQPPARVLDVLARVARGVAAGEARIVADRI